MCSGVNHGGISDVEVELDIFLPLKFCRREMGRYVVLFTAGHSIRGMDYRTMESIRMELNFIKQSFPTEHMETGWRVGGIVSARHLSGEELRLKRSNVK